MVIVETMGLLIPFGASVLLGVHLMVHYRAVTINMLRGGSIFATKIVDHPPEADVSVKRFRRKSLATRIVGAVFIVLGIAGIVRYVLGVL